MLNVKRFFACLFVFLLLVAVFLYVQSGSCSYKTSRLVSFNLPFNFFYWPNLLVLQVQVPCLKLNDLSSEFNVNLPELVQVLDFGRGKFGSARNLQGEDVRWELDQQSSSCFIFLCCKENAGWADLSWVIFLGKFI